MFITFRRHHLDELLLGEPFAGDILDVGGDRLAKRGRFRPPLQKVRSWKYLNIDAATQPDFCCSAETIPTDEATFDSVLLCEVIEHLEAPERALRECARVLRPKGKILATIPFLYGVHAHPHDYQRWTPERIQREFNAAGFANVEVRPMGGLLAVLADLFEMYCHLEFERKGRIGVLTRTVRIFVRRVLGSWLLRRDAHLPYQDLITTGYAVRATRP